MKKLSLLVKGKQRKKYYNFRTYGIVTKCKYKPTGQIVAVKQFKDSEEDEHIKKIAVREVRILKKLRHPNIINLIDVFRSKKRLYLVFEYVEGTVLSKLENSPCGVPEPEMKRYMIQLLMALNYCHSFNVWKIFYCNNIFVGCT